MKWRHRGIFSVVEGRCPRYGDHIEHPRDGECPSDGNHPRDGDFPEDCDYHRDNDHFTGVVAILWIVNHPRDVDHIKENYHPKVGDHPWQGCKKLVFGVSRKPN